MRQKILFGIILVNLALSTIGQEYRVYFKDKGKVETTELNPLDLLSEEALTRRAHRGIALDMMDVPVKKEYLDQLKSLGFDQIMCSRWLNYAKVNGQGTIDDLRSLHFVKLVERVEPAQLEFAAVESVLMDSVSYGFSQNQIEMLNGHYLHNEGRLGQGMRIAVLDGGFGGTKTLNGLDSLWADNRIIESKSFIAGDTNVFAGGTHGTGVLSVMAGYIDTLYVGSAWKAEYLLYKTEFEATETSMEMDNWIAAAERADSLGVDVISSSLGYTTFDDGKGDLSYADLDGNTANITRAADIAAAKGILVVVSAGNLGDSPWRYISAPADGDSVMAVAAVWPHEAHASFSSTGPSADGRIKPDVSAQGVSTAILTPAGIAFGNGTSFSCPLISGLSACLWQSYPGVSAYEIMEAIKNSASHAFIPNNYVGFGIANFRDAEWMISNEEYSTEKKKLFDVYPNPNGGDLTIDLSALEGVELIKVHDIGGNLVLES